MLGKRLNVGFLVFVKWSVKLGVALCAKKPPKIIRFVKVASIYREALYIERNKRTDCDPSDVTI